MNDMQSIAEGFAILAKYDDTKGQVNGTYNRELYAGPQGLAWSDFTREDAEKLEELSWYFDEQIGRWGTYL